MEVNGIIESIEDDVAWGTLEDGMTFDVPANKHSVGDTVKYFVHDDDEEEECGYTHSIILFGSTRATLYACNLTDEGLEIEFYEEFHKPAN